MPNTNYSILGQEWRQPVAGYIFACFYTCRLIGYYVDIDIYIFIFLFLYLYISITIYLYLSYICYIYMCVCVYIYIYIYIYIYTYTHKYKFTSKCQSETILYSDRNTWIGMEIASTTIFVYTLGYLSEAANKLYTRNSRLSF